MRLICTLHDQTDAKKLSHYLTAQNISNEMDAEINGDWGSPDYGTVTYKIWVTDEDQAQEAYAIYANYANNPSDPRFDTAPPRPASSQMPPPPPPLEALAQPMPPITRFLLLICIVLFAWGAWNSPEYKSSTSTIEITPIFTSPLKIDLLYDYPKAYSLLAELVTRFGIDALQDPKSLPPQGQQLVEAFNETPYWQGYYERILQWIHDKLPTTSVPWFEKIQQGEIWRIFSPILLHGDIFHLMFNMIWLYVLGKQLEIHIGPWRYILFILIAAGVSNTAQYLMSGPNFLGISGVLAAMLTFIWRRQVEAPWEKYQLQQATFIFIMIFILGLSALQFISFIVEAITGAQISTFIANTAHITGGLMGLLFARIPFFTKTPNPPSV